MISHLYSITCTVLSLVSCTMGLQLLLKYREMYPTVAVMMATIMASSTRSRLLFMYLQRILRKQKILNLCGEYYMYNCQVTFFFKHSTCIYRLFLIIFNTSKYNFINTLAVNNIVLLDFFKGGGRMGGLRFYVPEYQKTLRTI